MLHQKNYPKLLQRSSLHTLGSKTKAVPLTLNYHKIGLWCAINETLTEMKHSSSSPNGFAIPNPPNVIQTATAGDFTVIPAVVHFQEIWKSKSDVQYYLA